MIFDISTERINVGKFYIDKIAENPLPLDYRAVEYLQSSGTQYIDCSGLNMNQSDNGNYIECKACESDDYSIFGYYQALNLTASDGYYRMYGYGNGRYNSDVPVGLATPHVFKLDAGNFYIDNTLKQTFSTVVLGVGRDIRLFARSGSSMDIGGTVRIYYFKFGKIQNDAVVLQADMIPCVRISDDKPGMYDLVSRSFYTNSGTGEFATSEEAV